MPLKGAPTLEQRLKGTVRYLLMNDNKWKIAEIVSKRVQESTQIG